MDFFCLKHLLMPTYNWNHLCVFSSANEINKLKVSLHFSNVHKKKKKKKTELITKQNQHRIAVIWSTGKVMLPRVLSVSLP